jgi:uncharacterized protein (TIGR03067 family)
MTRFAVALVLVSGGLVGAADDPAPKGGLDGTYKLISAERDGKLAPKELVETVTVVFKGDEFTLSTSPDDKKVAKLKIASDSKPLATIDIVPADGEYKGMTLLGIYKLEKGELTIAYNEKGDRPKEFKSDSESVILLKLKKVEK